MKLKYYLRGLGIGIIVTFLILFFTRESKSSMTDAEVVARAKELGMTENVTMSEASNSMNSTSGNVISSSTNSTSPNKNSNSENSTSSNKNSNSGNSASASINSSSNNKADEAKNSISSDDSSSNNKPEESSSNDDKVTITIKAGDSSYSAAKTLQKEGLIESAAKFDEYLCRNGYDKYLVVGSHKIPKGATDKQIADIITGRN